MAHAICRPYVLKERQDGTVAEVNARLPRSLAVMYLDWRGEWRLRSAEWHRVGAAAAGRRHDQQH